MVKIIITTKNADIFFRNGKPVTKNTGSNIKEQYSALQTEYLQNLSAMQNVITINLAITLGLVAAYVALLTNPEMQNYTYIKAIFIMLPIIGLYGAISCIRTLPRIDGHNGVRVRHAKGYGARLAGRGIRPGGAAGAGGDNRKNRQ